MAGRGLSALALMREGPVIPVIVLHEVAQAVPLARALLAGGVRVLEVTLRTPAALACIEAIARALPQALVGAGTVRSPADVQAAARAGARFIVSPGYSADVDGACHDEQLPLLPGVMTASDIMQAQHAGHQALKFFPATAAGGLPLLQALCGPFNDVHFCPTGGITLAQAPAWLAHPQVVCVGGSWLTPAEAIARGDWDAITQRAVEATALVRGSA